MVRVLMCYNFKEQKVFSDAYLPTAIACSVSLNFVFVSSLDGRVLVYSLAEDGFPQICQFPLVSPAKELFYNDFGSYILTRETTSKDRQRQSTARVYYNWSKWDKNKGKKIRQHFVGFSNERSFSLEPGALTAVEISSRFSVRTLSCCPASGNIAVATKTTVSVYKHCLDCPYDLERIYFVEAGFSISKLALCEQFVAFASTSEVRVLRVTLAGQETPWLSGESVSKDLYNSETEQFLASGILSNSVTQREVFNEQFVVWSFDQRADPSSKQNFWDNILASREWNENDDESQTPTIVELPSVMAEIPYIDHNSRSCEIFGPVKTVCGHPLTVQGTSCSTNDMTMLYRCFEEDTVNGCGDELFVIQTLQLVPFYTNDCNEDQMSNLSGMFCFVSSPNKGIVYNVFSTTEIISQCTYTSNTKMAVIEENILYTVTKHGIETYSMPFYATVSKETRARLPLDHSNKLEEHTFSEVEADHAGSTNHVGNGGNGEAMESKDGANLPGIGSRCKKTDSKFGFPVYDLDILQKPCPLPCDDLCMIGVHPFKDLYFIVTAGKRILLLSDDTSSSASRHRRRSKNAEREKTTNWTLHVLQAMGLEELYSNMASLTEKSEGFNTQADLRLLKEQHLILRCQAHGGNMLSKSKRNQFLVTLKNSAKHIGDYYARYAEKDFEDVLLYYTMANVSFEDIVNEQVEETIEIDRIKDRKFGKGLLCYLNDVLFHKNQEKNCISLPKKIADKVLYIYSNAEPASLSTLIVRPLISGYCPEIAAKLLIKMKKTKGYSFSAEDHLALAVVYLKLCALEHAAGELLNSPKDNLAEVCVKRHYILYEKDESLSPLAQLMRRRLPKIFIKTLVSLHLRGIMTLTNAIETLQVKSYEDHKNTHLVEFLELVLNDQKGKQSFKEARELLIDIYFNQLTAETVPSQRDLLRLPHYHVPRGSGHFSKRYSWLDQLPPFDGFLTEPKDCPYVKKSAACATSERWNNQLQGSSPSRQSQSVGPGASTRCTCCCCWETLLKLQSLLCSRYRDEDLASFVLNKVFQRSSPSDVSITLLCLPLVGEHEKAIELLLETQPSVILTYGNQYFGKTHVKWQCVLNVLTHRIREGKDMEKKYKLYKEILQETLMILSKNTTPSVLLSLLPDDGNFAFFLPFLVESCKKTTAQGLANQIIAR